MTSDQRTQWDGIIEYARRIQEALHPEQRAEPLTCCTCRGAIYRVGHDGWKHEWRPDDGHYPDPGGQAR